MFWAQTTLETGDDVYRHGQVLMVYGDAFEAKIQENYVFVAEVHQRNTSRLCNIVVVGW